MFCFSFYFLFVSSSSFYDGDLLFLYPSPFLSEKKNSHPHTDVTQLRQEAGHAGRSRTRGGKSRMTIWKKKKSEKKKKSVFLSALFFFSLSFSTQYWQKKKKEKKFVFINVEIWKQCHTERTKNNRESACSRQFSFLFYLTFIFALVYSLMYYSSYAMIRILLPAAQCVCERRQRSLLLYWCSKTSNMLRVCVCVCCQLFVLYGGASIAQVIRTLRNVTETRSLPNELRKIKKDNEKKKTSTIESVKKKSKNQHCTRDAHSSIPHALLTSLFLLLPLFIDSPVRVCVYLRTRTHLFFFFSDKEK